MRLQAFLFGLAVFTVSVGALAHHGTSASYDEQSYITVEGTVKEFRWRNPHASLYLDLVDDSGEHSTYGIELPSPTLMSRTLGWTRRTFKPGDKVKFRVHPSRTGASVGVCLSDCEVYVNGQPLDNQVADPID